MEDGHSLFDYDVGLNDIIQLMIRPLLTPHPSQQNGEGVLGKGEKEVREEEDKEEEDGGNDQTADMETVCVCT